MRLEGWHIVILVLLAVLLFGAPKLPGLARSVGQSLRIFRSEVRQMKDENPPAGDPAAASDLPPAGPVSLGKPVPPGPVPAGGPVPDHRTVPVNAPASGPVPAAPVPANGPATPADSLKTGTGPA